MNFCPMCGERCMKGAAFCMNCGTKLPLDTDAFADVTKATHTSPSYDITCPPTLPQKSKKREELEITKFIYNILLVIYAGLSYLSVLLAWVNDDYFYMDDNVINCALVVAALLLIVGVINFIQVIQGLKIKNDTGTSLSCIFRFVTAILITVLAFVACVERGF